MNVKNIVFNLPNNSIVDKTTENLRKIVNVKFVNKEYHKDQHLEEI